MGAVLAVVVVLVVAAVVVVGVAGRVAANAGAGASLDDELAFLGDLGAAGRDATVAPLAADDVPADLLRLETLFDPLGFARVAMTRTSLPGKPAELTLHLADADRRVVVRVGQIPELRSPPSVTATSWFPGGRVATSRLASASALPGEVLQCVPDASPVEVVEHQRAALAALAARGAAPVAAPADLAAELQREWRTESAVMIDGDPVVRRALAEQLRRGPTRRLLTDAPDVDDVAARLAAPPA